MELNIWLYEGENFLTPKEILAQLVSTLIWFYHTQPMKDHDKHHGDITLHDIVAHIQGVQKTMRCMEKRLSDRIDGNAKGIQSNATAIQQLASLINRRCDSLEEDLCATMSDTITIRKHVGMSVVDN